MRFAFFAMAVTLMGCDSSQGSAPTNQSPAVDDSAQPEPHLTLTIPDDERDFMQALLEGAEAYKAAPNELKKSSVKKGRDKKLHAITPRGNLTGWYGKLTEMKTTSDGNAYITVAMPEQLFTLKTWNNDFSDIEHHTLIKNGSALYNDISNMKIGQYVKISGQLLKEGSVTEAGSMINPEFIVRFTSVEAIN